MHFSPNDLFQFENGATREERTERGSANPVNIRRDDGQDDRRLDGPFHRSIKTRVLEELGANVKDLVEVGWVAKVDLVGSDADNGTCRI